MKILVVIFLIPFFISNGIFEIIEVGDISCDLLSEEIARMKGTIHILSTIWVFLTPFPKSYTPSTLNIVLIQWHTH